MTSTVYTPTSTTTSQCKNMGSLPMPTVDLSTGAAVRKASRENAHKTSTSGLAPSYLQANLIILPSKYASDFRILCARNPVPCPLLAESRSVGRWDAVKSWLEGVADSAIASDVNLAKDAPRYMVYKDGELVKFECDDVIEEWTEDHIAFLIGCSYSFESALSSAGLTARHTTMGRNTTMYKTNIPLCPAGVFTGGAYVVSMRPYKLEEIEQVRAITRPYIATHGEPIAWGWQAVKDLGIQDIDKPEWGAAPLTLDGKALSQVEGDTDNVPVFWGCGVTPQEAVMRARLPGISMGHAPGHMLVLDCRDWDIVKDN